MLAIASPSWKDLYEQTDRIIGSYHGKFPLRRGIPREELKSRLDLTPRLFNALVDRLALEGRVVAGANTVAKVGHEIRFDNRQQATVQSLMLKFAHSPYAPPGVKECQAEAGEEIVNALVELGELKAVSSEIVFRKRYYDSMVAKVHDALIQNGKITLAEVRD